MGSFNPSKGAIGQHHMNSQRIGRQQVGLELRLVASRIFATDVAEIRNEMKQTKQKRSCVAAEVALPPLLLPAIGTAGLSSPVDGFAPDDTAALS